MIAVVDYGLGNVAAFLNIYDRLGRPAFSARDSASLDRATHIILPGVGSFDWAMRKLNKSGMRDRLDHLVLERGIPALGVCVGMQMMATGSTEGIESGLNWIPGSVRRFSEVAERWDLPLPHMGWNSVRSAKADVIWGGLTNPRFYFLHSFLFAPDDPDAMIGQSEYHVRFASAIKAGNIVGTQFHPEKSHDHGVRVLDNFAQMPSK